MFVGVSIHAFRGEGDVVPRRRNRPPVGFQSTPSGGKATYVRLDVYATRGVSIHAFRGEGDVAAARLFLTQFDFSIHAFRGEGDSTPPRRPARGCGFNPRLPGGRRPPSLRLAPRRGVSIHAFRGEGDAGIDGRAYPAAGFNPRLPGGRRPDLLQTTKGRPGVSIHAFRGEGDRRAVDLRARRRTFQSTPSGGKATRARVVDRVHAGNRFNPRLPGGRRQDGAVYVQEIEWVSIHAFRGEGD